MLATESDRPRSTARLGVGLIIAGTCMIARSLGSTTTAAVDARPAQLHELRAAAGGEARKPHVVFVLLDDVGFNDFGYGSTDLGFVTPFLDGLSRDGVRFAQLYAMPVCTPSRAALLTGK